LSDRKATIGYGDQVDRESLVSGEQGELAECRDCTSSIGRASQYQSGDTRHAVVCGECCDAA